MSMANSPLSSHVQQEKGIALERVACPRCGHENSRIMVKGRDRLYKIPGEYQAVECARCHLWFQNPRPIIDNLTSLYPQNYLPHQKPTAQPLKPGAVRYLRNRFGYSRLVSGAKTLNDSGWLQILSLGILQRWRAGVDLIPTFVADGKLLEIGCGNGSRLLSLRQLGWQHLHGIELVPGAAEMARAEGFSVLDGQVEDILDNYPDAEFDVIVSSMVLEHLVNPFNVVHMIANKLKPGGQFLFSTVVRNGLDAKMFRGYWSGFDFPRHMVYFQKSDLYEMLKEHFEAIEIFHQNAPIDFVRPPVSRKQEGKGSFTDNLIIVVANSVFARYIGLLLAWTGLTSRVSFYCIRKHQ